MKYLSVIILLISGIAHAELPDILKDPATKEVVEFLDAKISAVSNSSSTLLTASFSTTNTGFVCITGSTLTITTNGGRVLIGFNGAFYSAATAGIETRYAPIVDNVPLYALLGATGFNNSTVNYSMPVAYTALTNPLPAGVHTFCAAVKVNTGTNSMDISISTPQFWVQELR